jgi:hypothetical protein
MPVHKQIERLCEMVLRAKKRLVVAVDEEDGEGYGGLGVPYAALRGTYQQLTDVMLDEGKPLLDVRVLLRPHFCNIRAETISYVPEEVKELRDYRIGQFKIVAIGGTFDHLHAGHKLMLSVAAMLSSKLVVCGVTGISSAS